MKKIIVLSDGKQYFADSFEEIIKLIFGKDYLDKSFNEKFKIRYQKAFGICVEKELDLVDTRVRKAWRKWKNCFKRI